MTAQFVETAAQLRVTLFGHFRIEREKGVVRLPTRKVKSLFAYLVLHPGPHSREKLAALLWGDFTDRAARASLRNALAILRKKLGQDLLLANRETVQLDETTGMWVDALAFEEQATRFLKAPAAEPGVVNLDLYKGDLLADFYSDWVLARREQLRALYVETLLACTQQMRSQSEYEGAIAYAERALGVDGANERAHQHLMFCQAATGNRGAALLQYEACRRALQEELAVEPSAATERLQRWIQQAPAERLPVEAAITNLPIPVTSFVGRQGEMAAVKNLLRSARLLTLTGAGGSGKTRLAIQAAMDLLEATGDGVWWVDLAALADGALVPRTVAKALGAPEVPQQTTAETLANFLRRREVLLLLDNCEHVIGACAPLVERMLRDCPQLKIMATSREMLGVGGEQVWPVTTLSLPDTDQSLPAEALLQFEAIRLFCERARAIRPDFTLTERNAAAVADICRRVDGIPLAIELAAALANVLTVGQIARRLDDVFHLLKDGGRSALPRHQTLRAAIDWSYNLLAAGERALFGRLSVFAGGWTLRAAEAICSGEGIEEREVFDLQSRLVQKSLVEMAPGDKEARFRMLQTIQQYSHERLLEARTWEQVHARHLHYFSQLAEAANAHLGYFLTDAESDAWFGRLAPENDNLRAALRWSVEQENAPRASIEAGLRLAGNLHWYWSARGDFAEGRAWLARLLQLGGAAPARTRAQALLSAGYLACWQGAFAAGRAPLEEALALFRRLEDGEGIAFTLHGLGFVALGEGNAALSRALFEESLGAAREVNDSWLTVFAMHFLAIVLTYEGLYGIASAYFEEGNAMVRQMGGNRQGLAFSLFHLARIARLQGDYATAWSRHREGIRLFRLAGDRRGAGYSLAGMAILAMAQGDLRQAVRLCGAVASLQALLGPFLEAPLQSEYDRELAAMRAALEADAFAAAWAEGREMTVEQAIESVLETGNP